jgi:hypothetical protein
VHEAQRHHRRRRGGGQRGGRVRRRGGPPLHPRPFPAPARPRGETLGGAAASGLGGGGAGEDGLGQAGGAEVAMSGAAIEIRAGGGGGGGGGVFPRGVMMIGSWGRVASRDLGFEFLRVEF